MMFLTQYILLPGDVNLSHLIRQAQEHLLREVQEGGPEVVESAQVDHVYAGETQTLVHLSRQVQEQLLREGVREEDQEVPEVEGREGFECEWESFGLF